MRCIRVRLGETDPAWRTAGWYTVENCGRTVKKVVNHNNKAGIGRPLGSKSTADGTGYHVARRRHTIASEIDFRPIRPGCISLKTLVRRKKLLSCKCRGLSYREVNKKQ